MINFGGDDITEAIARKLSISCEEAEKLKVMHGSVLDTSKENEMLLEIPSINFENEVTKNDQKSIQLSRISINNSGNDIIYARGEADSKALYIRYHDESIDQKYAPKGDIALNLFNEMEKARCEAVGGSIYPGAAKNIENNVERESKRFFEKSEPKKKFPLQDSLRLLIKKKTLHYNCLLYTSDAADE